MTRRGYFAVAGLLLAFASLWAWHAHTRRMDVERRAGAAASRIAGRSVRVHCPGFLRKRLSYEINDGWVRYRPDGRPGDEARLAGEVCAGLRRLVDRGAALDLSCLALDACSADDRRVALAVAVLAHESVHLRGVTDEAATECEAVGRSPAVARSLGASDAAASAIADWQFSVHDDELPERYQSGRDCRVPGA